MLLVPRPASTRVTIERRSDTSAIISLPQWGSTVLGTLCGVSVVGPLNTSSKKAYLLGTLLHTAKLGARTKLSAAFITSLFTCFLEYRLYNLIVSFLNYKSLHGAAQDYLKSYCVWVSTSRARARLRSEVKGDLKVRKLKTCFGNRAFSVAGPQCWNNISTFI